MPESFDQQLKAELTAIIHDLEREKAQLEELYAWFEEVPELDDFYLPPDLEALLADSAPDTSSPHVPGTHPDIE